MSDFDFNKARELADKYSHLFEVRTMPSVDAPQSEWDEHFSSIFKANRELGALYGVQVNDQGMSRTIDDQRMAERIEAYYRTHPNDRFVQIPYQDTMAKIPTMSTKAMELAEAIKNVPDEKLDKILQILRA
jgi:hypothetical protein